MPTPFEANLDVTKTLVAMVVTALIAIGGLVFAWTKKSGAQDAGWSGDTLVPLGIGVVVFFVMATVSFKQYRTYDQGRSGPIVRIDESGVLDRRQGPNPIPWSAISGAEIKDISNAHMVNRKDEDKRQNPQIMGVVLTVENAAQYLDGDGALGAAAKAIGEATGHDQFILSPEGLSTTAEDMLKAVEAYRAGKAN